MLRHLMGWQGGKNLDLVGIPKFENQLQLGVGHGSQVDGH